MVHLSSTRATSAHRFAYEQLVGPVPARYILHHTCEVRRCVNPEHLEPLTRGEHAKRHRAIELGKAALVEAEGES
jgi:hypothetical protein